MKCPGCGENLTEDEDPHKTKNERLTKEHFDARCEWEDNGFIGNPPEELELDESYMFTCHHKGCYLQDTFFIMHHPLRGLDSEPTDSWSLTWIK